MCDIFVYCTENDMVYKLFVLEAIITEVEMKIKIFLFFVLLTIGFSNIRLSAQTPILTTQVEKIVNYYNSEKSDSLFYMFNEAMQKALPLEQTEQFLKQTKIQLGKINKYEFGTYINNNRNMAIYDATFENGLFDIIVVLENDLISGFSIKPHKNRDIEIIERNSTEMILPFNDKWYVVWGGDTEKLNYHVISDAQKNAFDFVIIGKEGKSFSNGGSKNEDYYCFGKELFAPCDGVVLMTVDGIKDNQPGKMNNSFPMGNTVILKAENGKEFIYLCHFKQFSIKVKEGQKVKQGELLGLCGNSGRSSEAHLHFHLQNTDDDANATGIKCYFKEILVDEVAKKDYSPIQAEVVEQKK